ncbi:DMT family transporter [Paenibacillaceae bacterium WGS1546]|uniref:DMT family transporter n=1 Tax=Cohnella sp. WGS1546 TaxID=3366810 RepID=UPI00372D2403
MTQLSRTRTAVYLAFLVLMWGINWPLSKFALGYAPPLLFAGLRIFIGGLLLLPFAITRYKKLNLKQTWPIYLISSALNIVLFYYLQTIGLNEMPAGQFSTIVFLQPVLLGIGSWLWLKESMFMGKWVGLLLGFIGVALVCYNGGTGSASVTGIVLGLGSAVCYAAGTIYMKRTAAHVDAVWLITLQTFIGGLALLIMGTSFESWGEIVWNTPFLVSLAVIALFVTALGWLAYFSLVGSGEASKVGAYTFLIPLTATLTSVIFLGETVKPEFAAGFVLVITSIVLVNRKPMSRNVERSEAA